MFSAPMDIRHLFHWTRRRLFIHYPRLLGRWLLARRHPEVMLIELTNDCNQSCPFCSRETMTRKVGYMPFEVFTALIDQAAAYPYMLLRVVGLGEAAMHPRFRDCIAYASARGIPMEITSNGHIFEVMRPEEIMASSIIMLSISIDGFGDGTYEKMRPGGNYKTLRRNIETFYRAKRATRRKRPFFTLRNVLLGRTAEKRARQAARFGAEWAGLCDRMSFNDYIPQTLTVRNEGRLRVCDDILYNLHVEWDGRTPLCPYQHMISAPEETGNIGTVPLSQVWNDPRRQEIRKAHIRGDLSPARFCEKCPKTRQAAVYRSTRDHVRHGSPLYQRLERLLWRIVS